MGNFHPKVQEVIDRQIADSNDKIAMLEAKLAQLEKFDSQKATLEETINQLTKENADLVAELQKVTDESAALKEALDAANLQLAEKATSGATTITEPDVAETTVIPDVADAAKEEAKSAPEVKETPVDEKAAKKAAKKEDNKK